MERSIDREKVVEEYEDYVNSYISLTTSNDYEFEMHKAVLAMLKEQEGYVSVPFSWLVKFCTHIDFVEPLTDAEREVAWRQKLRRQFGINASKMAVK